MIDKSIESIGVMMYKTDTNNYPKYSLPEGYYFEFYKKGDENNWAQIEMSVGQYDTKEEALSGFERSFIQDQNLILEERMLFVKDLEGNAVATASLWNGFYLGEECQRIHWVAVMDKCAGLGIAKAMLTKLMDLYNELGYYGFIYLSTGTRNFPAISIYRKFGFIDYHGEVDPRSNVKSEAYYIRNEKAFEIINSKIAEHKK